MGQTRKKGQKMDRKLIIQPHRHGGDSTVVSIRMPKDMVSEIDEIASGTGRARNEIIVTMLEFALKNTEVRED